MSSRRFDGLVILQQRFDEQIRRIRLRRQRQQCSERHQNRKELRDYSNSWKLVKAGALWARLGDFNAKALLNCATNLPLFICFDYFSHTPHF